MNAAIENIDSLQGDDELERKVRLNLRHTGHRSVKAIVVQARDGVVTLRGSVPSFYVRQLAIACVRRVAGVQKVIDQIDASSRVNVQVTETA